MMLGCLARLPIIRHAICMSQGRSSKWPALERKFLKEHPECVICGRPAKIVHHCVPVSWDPSKELDESNLRSICCESEHRLIAHLNCYTSYNSRFDSDAFTLLGQIQNRPKKMTAVVPGPTHSNAHLNAAQGTAERT